MKAVLTMDATCVPCKEFPGKWRCLKCPTEGIGPVQPRCPKCNGIVEQRSGLKPSGTVIDLPNAFVLVRQGIADPVDDDCKAMVRRSPEQLRAARHAYIRSTRGIHPEDFDAYDRGLMVGYNADGSHKPGPAAVHSESTDTLGGGEAEPPDDTL